MGIKHPWRLALVWGAVYSSAAVLTSPAAADEGAMYGRLSLDAVTASDFRNNNAAATARFSPKTGWAVAGVVGYRLAEQFRLELDIGHRRHGVEGTFARNARIACGSPAVPCIDGAVDSGRLAATSLMATVAWDLPAGSDIRPYVAAGVGPMRLSLRARTMGTFATGPSQSVELVGGADTVLAARVGAGIRTGVRSFTVTLGYHYLSSAAASFAGNALVAAVAVNLRLKSHSLGAGIQFPF